MAKIEFCFDSEQILVIDFEIDHFFYEIALGICLFDILTCVHLTQFFGQIEMSQILLSRIAKGFQKIKARDKVV